MNRQRSRINVFLVDDDVAILRIASKYLSDSFADRVNLWTTEDSRAAVAQFDESQCDLLITDIQMPEIDGLEVLRFAKTRNPWTQVVMFTGHNTIDRMSQAIELGASDYLLKPIVSDDFKAVVEQQLQRIARWKQTLVATMRHAPSRP